MGFWTAKLLYDNHKQEKRWAEDRAQKAANHQAYRQAGGRLGDFDWHALGQPTTPHPTEAAMVDAWLSEEDHPALLMAWLMNLDRERWQEWSDFKDANRSKGIDWWTWKEQAHPATPFQQEMIEATEHRLGMAPSQRQKTR